MLLRPCQFEKKIFCSLIACGVEKTGQVIIFNRAALYQEEVEQPVLPRERLQVAKEGASVTSLDIQEELMVTGTSDGSVSLYNLQTGTWLYILTNACVCGVKKDENFF